ncbi:formyltransferase family protein [Aquimarina intermedia]|uniref:phosphoribosylglycinamide formyltransferase 1 n=1 Tax=Aquimarina intermedia TaxID=350814 RepID=A0A5S5C965_9FLAO|nr:formyltransferase family protein [Aquimarina intermedia]TYP75158.1 phosphoribosylglycinamide formyltransferase-1 [Aquimarina intermedia]
MKNVKAHNWAILTTGWGRNAYDLIKEFKNNKLNNHTIALLIYEAEPCGAAEIAKEIGIRTLRIERKRFKDSEAYQIEICEKLKEFDIDFIFLLNYKYIVKEPLLSTFENKILNIHPSLLPSFKGTKTAIQDALAYGVKITGITTHYVSEELDGGTIIDQTAISVSFDDTFESLYPKFSVEGLALIKRSIYIVENEYNQSERTSA